MQRAERSTMHRKCKSRAEIKLCVCSVWYAVCSMCGVQKMQSIKHTVQEQIQKTQKVQVLNKAKAGNAEQSNENGKLGCVPPKPPVAADQPPTHPRGGAHVSIKSGEAGCAPIVGADPRKHHQGAQEVQTHGIPPVRKQGGTKKE